MLLEYFPNKGFKIEAIDLQWDEDRQSIRNKLENKHKEDNSIIDAASFFNGDTSHNFEQRRDIYQDYKEENYFFLSYNKEDKLNELEVHWGLNIHINGVELIFNEDINQFVMALKSIDASCTELDEGNYLFENLKMTISNSMSNGGEGNGLDYFYAAKDIIHLIE